MEVWKDIKGYEGLYQVSNLGRVKILEREYEKYNHLTQRMNIRKTEERLAKIIKHRTGYRSVSLRKDNKQKLLLVHRLVAENFIDNHDNYPVVNHIDGDKSNNKVDNLEWCTVSHNIQHSYDTDLRKGPRIKKVKQYDLEGNYIRTWESTRQAEKYYQISNGKISKVCLGKRKKTGGYIWRYESE